MFKEYKPYIEPEKPDYGRINYMGLFFNKSSNIIEGILGFAFIVIVSLLAVVFFDASNNTPDMDNAKIFGKSIITYHDNYIQKPGWFSGLSKDWNDLGPELQASLDSMYKADMLIAKNDSIQKRKEFIKDSILKELYVKDSIKKELIRQDSMEFELAKQRKIRVKYFAIVDDGITQRTVDVNSIVDTVTESLTEYLGKTFQEMSVNTVRDRQKEIEENSEYYKHTRIGDTETML